MNRLTIAAAVTVAACGISIPAVAALASDGSTSNRGPAHSRVVDERSGPNRSSDDLTVPHSTAPTSRASQPGDDKGTHVEPGDDRSSGVEPGDDNGTDAPGADNSATVEPGDDNGTSAPGDDHDSAGPGDDGGHHGHGG
jgi:hypothetical protein